VNTKELLESIRSGVAEYAPMVAGAISTVNPAAGAAVGLLAKVFGKDVSDVEGIAEAVRNATPEQKIAIISEGNRHKEALLAETNRHEEEGRAADSADIATVNETMRTEITHSKDETWYQKAWRPANGFAVALGSFCAVLGVVYLFYYALKKFGIGGLGMVVGNIPALAGAIAMILGVPGAAVGISAYQRGKQKRESG
jgi:hypothetical protein